MLRALSIRDYVIVERLDLELGAGFTALTGETGAGKSILLDALMLALGERADAGVVRAGAQRAEVSADFEVEALAGVRPWLAPQDFHGSDCAFPVRPTLNTAGGPPRVPDAPPAPPPPHRSARDRRVGIPRPHQ